VRDHTVQTPPRVVIERVGRRWADPTLEAPQTNQDRVYVSGPRLPDEVRVLPPSRFPGRSIGAARGNVQMREEMEEVENLGPPGEVEVPKRTDPVAPIA